MFLWYFVNFRKINGHPINGHPGFCRFSHTFHVSAMSSVDVWLRPRETMNPSKASARGRENKVIAGG